MERMVSKQESGAFACEALLLPLHVKNYNVKMYQKLVDQSPYKGECVMKKKTMLVIGLVVAFAAVFLCAGCGDQESQESQSSQESNVEASLDNGEASLKIHVMSDFNLGEDWISQFEQGAREEITGQRSDAEVTCSIIKDTTVADQILGYGLSEGFDGLLIAADTQETETAEAVTKAREQGVPVVGFGDNVNNGYNTAAPDDLGKSLAQVLVAQVALQQGADSWGQSDFGDQISRAVQGSWTTLNSSEDKKVFVFPYVMESSKNSEGRYEMNRVSLISDVGDTPDGNGYNYILNTGNNYYLYPENPGQLECHWEPDGYSGSDSLKKAADDTGIDSGGNSTFLLDMNTYGNSEEYFRGTISTFEGYGAMGNEPEECFALNLASPVRVYLTDGRDILLGAIQLNAEQPLSNLADTGTLATVTGELFEAHTDHHFTPVLMNVSGVE